MDKYQIIEIHNNENTAGSKAPNDVINIAEHIGFKNITIKIKSSKVLKSKNLVSKINRQKQYMCQWNNAYKKIPANSILLLQFPIYKREIGMYYSLRRLVKKKKVKIILVIHDLNFLRDTDRSSKVYKKDMQNFKKFSSVSNKIIVHNQAMLDYLYQLGISRSKMINLKIFDYLRKDKNKKLPEFDKSAIIAGNLNLKKSEYLKYISNIDFDFYLYGPNFTLKRSYNIHYGGVLKPSEIPNVLTHGFGLIWDGNSIDTCDGSYGKYLKYINPHKLSLYLASNLPVIVWNKAAEAEFIKKNNIGIGINSLKELPTVLSKIDSTHYEVMANNARKIAHDLIRGRYMERALEEAIMRIKNGK